MDVVDVVVFDSLSLCVPRVSSCVAKETEEDPCCCGMCLCAECACFVHVHAHSDSQVLYRIENGSMLSCTYAHRARAHTK